MAAPTCKSMTPTWRSYAIRAYAKTRSRLARTRISYRKIYAKLINQAIAGLKPEMTVCMHLCRGNYQSSWVAEGGYEPVAEVLFNAFDVDGFFLEYDSPRAGDFAPLRGAQG